jgi:murein DD-endopeptidase MepM/ murein hydrolase activator NlpD
MRNIFLCISIAFCVSLFVGGNPLFAEEQHEGHTDGDEEMYDFIVLPARGGSDDEKRAALDQKNQELQQIQAQVREQQKKLQETQAQTRTISNDLKSIDSSIKTIDLGIKSSEVLIDRLAIEEDLLFGDISSAQQEIAQKETAMADILRQMQETDSENLLFGLLKNKTLSEGIAYAQSLTDLNQNLLVTVADLQSSKTKLETSLQKTLETKEAKQVENENLKNKKVIASDLKKEKSTILAKTKQQETAYQKELRELEERQLKIAEEIEEMERQLRGQIDEGGLPKSVPGILAVPVQGIVTQEHGATRFAQRAYRGKWHNGLDFGAPVGTPVLAAEDGIVVSVEDQDRYCYRGAYGKYVAIKHGNGLTTLYAHLSLYKVSQGAQVKRGDVIGYVGKTGYATGAHLHFGVYDSSTFKIGPSNSCGPKMPIGGDLNPRQYLSL